MNHVFNLKQGRIRGGELWGPRSPGSLKGRQKKKTERKGQKKSGKKRERKNKKERKRQSNMTNRAPIQTQAGAPQRGSREENFTGAKLTVGGGVGEGDEGTILQLCSRAPKLMTH